MADIGISSIHIENSLCSRVGKFALANRIDNTYKIRDIVSHIYFHYTKQDSIMFDAFMLRIYHPFEMSNRSANHPVGVRVLASRDRILLPIDSAVYRED